jgi:hypothetical protein
MLFPALILMVLSTLILSLLSRLLLQPRPGHYGGRGGGSLFLPGAGTGGPGKAAGPAPLPSTATLTGASAASRGAQFAAALSRTDFTAWGLPAPSLHLTTTYLSGDNLYDESASLETAAGDLLGEVGVSLGETLGEGEARSPIAFEVWMFDAGSGQTATAVAVGPGAERRESLRARLEAKGTLFPVVAGAWVTLETATLQCAVRVVDLELKAAVGYPEQVFERLALEIAAWPHTGGPLPIRVEGVDPDPASGDPTTPNGTAMPEPLTNLVTTDYAIRYAARAYREQPFILRVSIPSEKPRRGAKVGGPVSATGRAGEISFRYTDYPLQPPEDRAGPGVRVDLFYQPGEFQVPLVSQTIPLRDGGAASATFHVKPVGRGTLLLAVKATYLGDKFLSEKPLEVLVTRDELTGHITSTTTRTIPAHYMIEQQPLFSETLSVSSVSLLGMPAGSYIALMRMLGLLLVAAVLLTVLVFGWIGSPLERALTVISALVAAQLLFTVIRRPRIG